MGLNWGAVASVTGATGTLSTRIGLGAISDGEGTLSIITGGISGDVGTLSTRTGLGTISDGEGIFSVITGGISGGAGTLSTRTGIGDELGMGVPSRRTLLLGEGASRLGIGEGDGVTAATSGAHVPEMLAARAWLALPAAAEMRLGMSKGSAVGALVQLRRRR
jgi:hypothetical protein